MSVKRTDLDAQMNNLSNKKGTFPIFCNQAGVGTLILTVFAVALLFRLFGSSLRPAISKCFDDTVRYLNSVTDKPDSEATRQRP